MILAPATAAADRFVYAGDSNFPPFEYLGPEGEPAGFNVALVRALARHAGHQVEVRLGTWARQVRTLDSGEADLMALAWSEARAPRYAFLVQFWTLRQSVVFPPGASNDSLQLDALGAEVVAVEEGGLVHELLAALPEARRPILLEARDHADAVRLMLRGDATAAAGNGFTLQVAARAQGVESLIEVPVKSLQYFFASRPDRASRLAWLAPALEELRASGAFDTLVERNLTHSLPAASTSWAQVGLSLAALLLILGGGALLLRRRSAARLTVPAPAASALLADVPDLMFLIDAQDALAAYHAPDDSLLVAPPERFLGRPAFEVLPEEIAAPLLAAAGQARREGSAAPYEYQLADQRGRLRDWEARAVRTREGKVLVMTRDITDRRRAETRLAALRESAREKERQRTIATLVGGIAHQLRNPLFGATAVLDVLATRFGATEEGDRLRSQLERITELSNRLGELGIARGGELLPEPVAEVVGEAVESCKALARDRGVLLTVELPTQLPSAPMQRQRIARALGCLLDNAIRASPAQASVRVGASVSDGSVAIRIDDRGTGIDPEHQRSIFEPFFALRPGGLGLGLAIARRHALDHGGEIDVETLPGGGTRFTLRLPLDPAQASRPPAPGEPG